MLYVIHDNINFVHIAANYNFLFEKKIEMNTKSKTIQKRAMIKYIRFDYNS